jgi:histidyl-tRNA synthetase
MQFDADTVGAESVAADAEMCMLAADTLEALGIKRGSFIVKVANRKIIDGILLAANIPPAKWLTVLRAVDKLDRLGTDGVRELLGPGRKDDSGDFTQGANLSADQISRVERLWTPVDIPGFEFGSQSGSGSFAVSRFDGPTEPNDTERVGVSGYIDNLKTLDSWATMFADCPQSIEGIDELKGIISICEAAGFSSKRIRADGAVVRGLEYYTGPVFEAELTFEVTDEKGRPVRFGSVGGGGRYDDLVARFTGQKVPATGFSIGVSRLQAALNALNKDKPAAAEGPVIVTVMEKERIADYQKMVQELRNANIRAELYLGNPKKFGKQLEYADKRGSPCVVIQGSDELAAGTVTLKDLVEGAKAAAAIKDNAAWKEQRPAQVTVDAKDLVAEVKKIIARHGP